MTKQLSCQTFRRGNEKRTLRVVQRQSSINIVYYNDEGVHTYRSTHEEAVRQCRMIVADLTERGFTL